MKLTRGLLLIAIPLLLFVAGCGTVTPAQEPTTLHVTRMDQWGHTAPRSWTITDVHAVQQLFDETQNLPEHQNNGTDSCPQAHYAYHLDFLAGTKSLQQDDLNTYCFTLTLADGSQRDPTAAFDARLSGMLHLSPQDV